MNPGVLEYGDKRGEMVGFQVLDDQGLPTTTIEKGTEFTMKVRVQFHQEISDPIFAFTIKDMRGTEITGTNTMFERIAVPPRKPGETDVVTFTQRADLQGGGVSDFLWPYGIPGRGVYRIPPAVRRVQPEHSFYEKHRGILRYEFPDCHRSGNRRG